MGASNSSTRLLLAAGLACVGFVWTADAEQLVPLQIKLPDDAAIGTPPETLPPGVEKPTGKPRPLLMVPPGLSNVALGKKVTSGDIKASPEKLAKIHRR
jgi:hypothetical protein